MKKFLNHDLTQKNPKFKLKHHHDEYKLSKTISLSNRLEKNLIIDEPYE
jgi:hypothetical protein